MGWLNDEVPPPYFDFGLSLVSGVVCLAIAVPNLVAGSGRVGAEFVAIASLAFLNAWGIGRDARRSTLSKPRSR